jgi:hypothetical protein
VAHAVVGVKLRTANCATSRGGAVFGIATCRRCCREDRAAGRQPVGEPTKKKNTHQREKIREFFGPYTFTVPTGNFPLFQGYNVAWPLCITDPKDDPPAVYPTEEDRDKCRADDHRLVKIRCMYTPRPPRLGNSFQDHFPAMSVEWHPTKNKPYGPSDVTWKSSFFAWWVCGECCHEYRAHVYTRALGHGCSRCAKKRTAEALRKPEKDQSFGDKHPELVSQWDSVRNGALTPFDVKPKSHYLAHWICDECHHKYLMYVSNRACGCGCPRCAVKRRAQTRRKPKPGKSFGDKYPELVPSWDSVRNAPLTPFDVNPQSTYVAHWICPRCKGPHRCAVYTRPKSRWCLSCGRKAGGDKNAATVQSQSFGAL